MPDHDHIYRNEAEQYEALIAREDYQHNIEQTIRRIVPDLAQAEVADIGAGTGRLTCVLAPLVKNVTALDASEAMLLEAGKQLSAAGLSNWQTITADNRQLPLQDHAVDLVTGGWTVCYIASSNVPDWEHNLEQVIHELKRVLKPGGTAILFENFGTGTDKPSPPDFLTAYYDKLTNVYGFSHQVIRTDYKFASPHEAESLCRFFFGDWLADPIAQEQRVIVPECTGVWWKRFE